MAECRDCGLDMSSKDIISCTLRYLIKDGKSYKRNTAYFDINKRCHDCNIVNKEGNFHHLGCDVERCPICGNQLISCGCFEF